VKHSSVEEIKNRPREYTFEIKEETFYGHMKRYLIDWTSISTATIKNNSGKRFYTIYPIIKNNYMKSD
jgi:hypothetical protein